MLANVILFESDIANNINATRIKGKCIFAENIFFWRMNEYIEININNNKPKPR